MQRGYVPPCEEHPQTRAVDWKPGGADPTRYVNVQEPNRGPRDETGGSCSRHPKAFGVDEVGGCDHCGSHTMHHDLRSEAVGNRVFRLQLRAPARSK